MADPYPSPYAGMPVPGPIQDFSETTTHGGSTVEGPRTDRKVKQPEVVEAERQAEAAAQAKVAAAQKEGEARLALEAIERDNAEKAAQLEAEHLRRKQEQQAANNQQIQAHIANAEARRAEMEKSAKITDYWQDRSTPARILSAIVLGMAEGANRGNGPSSAMQVYQDAVARDRQAKLDKYGASKEAFEGAQQRVGAAAAMGKDTLHQLDDEYISRANVLSKELEAAKKKVPQAAAGIDQTVAAIQADAAQKKMEQGNRYADEVHGQQVNRQASTSTRTVTGQKAGSAHPTEGQAKMALLAKQMQGELETIHANPGLMSATLDKIQANQLKAEAADKSAGSGIIGAASVGLGRAVGAIPRSKYEDLTAQEQKVANAWDNAVEKYARVLTGAGMPAEEARRMALQDAPHAGDSVDVVKQKLTRMDGAAQQMMNLSGAAGAQVSGVAPQAAPTPNVPAPKSAPAPARGKPSPDDLRALEWVRAHRDDPRASEILKRLKAKAAQ
jgi:hypothetical protein